jgi:hypothetical protein
MSVFLLPVTHCTVLHFEWVRPGNLQNAVAELESDDVFLLNFFR